MFVVEEKGPLMSSWSHPGGLCLAVSSTWTAPAVTGTAPTARDFHTTVVCGPAQTQLLVFGGAHEIDKTNTFVHFNDVHVFDTESNAWTKADPKGTPPSVRWGHAAVVKGSKVRACMRRRGCSSARC